MAENEYQSTRLIQRVFTIWVHFTCTNPVLEETLSSHARLISFSNMDTISFEKKDSENEIVFVIISSNEPILHQLDELEKVHSIFIYSPNHSSEPVELVQEGFRKVKGLFADILLLSRRILLQIKRVQEDFIPITIIPSGSSFLTQTDLNHLDSSFMYIKLFKDIFIDVTYTKEARAAFIDYYRTTFKQDEATKKMLDKIETYDDRQTLIQQYTSSSFLFGLLNQAIRHMDVEVLPLLGFLIHDLCWELEGLYWNSGISNQEKITVYRGQMLHNTECNRLTVGSLLYFNSFLSTSSDRAVAKMFAESCQTVANHTPIIFEILVEPQVAIHRFASVKDISTFSEEKEILFSMQAICRVVDIDRITDEIRYVRLSLTNDDDEKLRELTEYMTREVSGPTLMHRLGPLFIMLEQWSEAEDVYETLLEEADEDDETELANLHYQLGYISDKLGFPEDALDYYKKVLNLTSDLAGNERHQLAPTYAGIARLFYQEKNFNPALSYYKKAITFASAASEIDKIKIGGYYNEMALIFRDKQRYDAALNMLDKALTDVIAGGLPLTHPDLAKIYFNIASVYSMKKRHDKSLKYCRKCLDIQLHSLPFNHPALLRTHIAMSEILKERNYIKEAITHLEQAYKITKDPEKKKICQDQIEELQSKLQS